MSFLGGAECSTAGNPLSQFTKHVQDDKSLQHDRLVGRGPAGSLGGFRSANPNAPQDEVRVQSKARKVAERRIDGLASLTTASLAVSLRR